MIFQSVKLLAPRTSALHRIGESSQIRIGYARVAPWRRAGDGSALDRDLAACHDLSKSLGAIPIFIECRHSELVPGLHVGALDLAVGGLVDQSYPQITCITVRHPGNQLRDAYRRVLFRNVWCIRRGDLAWAALLRWFVERRRLRFACLTKTVRGIMRPSK